MSDKIPRGGLPLENLKHRIVEIPSNLTHFVLTKRQEERLMQFCKTLENEPVEIKLTI